MRVFTSQATDTFQIRPYEARDRAAIASLWGSVFPSYLDDPAREIDFCLRSGHGVIFVGCQDDEIVATIMAGHDGNRGWLHRIATRPDQRGRGFAARLVAHAEMYLTGLGVPKINLQIRTDNAATQGFYERIGYVAEPRISMGKRFAEAPPLALPDADMVPTGRLRVVITHMEMLRRPRLPAPPPPAMKLSVLRADEISVPFYRYLYNTVGAPWLWYERRRLSDDQLAAIVQHPEVDVFVLSVSGEPAGYAELDRRAMPEIELAYFGLMPHFIGRGLGPWLLHWVIDAAWLREPKRVWVHTCNLDHPKAFVMYQRAGFAPYRQEAKLVLDPRPLR